jgi:hypothetical protein
MLITEIIAVYSAKHIKYINTMCSKNAQFFNVKAVGTCSYHCDFKGQMYYAHYVSVN